MLALGALLGALGCTGDGAGAPPRAEPPLGDRLPIDEELDLEGLEGPVDAVRDEQGRIHIYATSVADAVRVQGYLVARDRHVQLEFLRRAATGRLAEMLGHLDASLVETDIAFRHIGLGRTAAQIYERLPDDVRDLLDAYADGISQRYAQYRSGEAELPQGVKAIKTDVFSEWTAVDSLALGRLQTWLLSYSGDEDISNTSLYTDLVTTFAADDPDALVAKRAGMVVDFLRLAPTDPATTVPSLGDIGAHSLAAGAPRQPLAARPEVPASAATPRLATLMRRAASVTRALDRVRDVLAPRGDTGSNNWAVGPSRSATGNAMLASDPHLGLGSPATFWPVSMHVSHSDPALADRDLHVGGIAFPGIPGIILGHNEHIAWGATVAVHDVTDVYEETLTADGSAVIFGGDEVPLETVEEEIADGKGNTITYEVKIVPHHGPIFPTIVGGKVKDPDPAEGALSVRWTGLEPTDEIVAVVNLLRAESVDEGIEALQDFGVGAQNFMLADIDGNIGWTTHALVPYRAPGALAWDAATYEGRIPCLVLPGDGSAEWTGFWPDAQVPWQTNPAAGYIATANNDPVGGTLDNDPTDDLQPDGSSAFLSCTYAPGHRQGRIQERIEAVDAMTLEEMSAIQGDHKSPLGTLLVPSLLMAIERAQVEALVPGTHADLSAVVADPGYDRALVEQIQSLLAEWRDVHDYAAASGVDPDDNQPLSLEEPEARASQAALLFNAWLVRMAARVFGDELARVGREGGHSLYGKALPYLTLSEPTSLATYDADTGDSALWDDLDTPEIESRQERMIRALVDAMTWLQERVGPIDSWRWGAHHTLSAKSPAPLFVLMDIPAFDDPVFQGAFPRHGDMYNVDACHYDISKGVADDFTFAYSSGPTQRFVIEMARDGLRVRNALPGGAVWDPASPHHADQMEAWRRNEVYDIPFVLDDVIAKAESRTVAR